MVTGSASWALGILSLIGDNAHSLLVAACCCVAISHLLTVSNTAIESLVRSDSHHS